MNEDSYIDPSEELCHQLALLRRRASLSGHKLAKILGITQASVSRIENGLQSPTPQVVELWLEATNASKQICVEVRELVEEILIRRVSPFVHRLQDNETTKDEKGIFQWEQEARRIRTCQIVMVPSLLQTTTYARQIFNLGPLSPSKVEIEGLMRKQQERQGQLFDESKIFEFIIFEQALMSTFASKEIMIEQFRHLLRIAQFPNIWIGVVPLGVLLPSVSVCPFQVFDEDLIIAETIGKCQETQDEKEIEMCLWKFDEWSNIAVSGSEFDVWMNSFIRKFAKLVS